ncbi:MAG TPA: tetratricopeptide repeat protein [Hansschlegelia sp.]
MTLIDRRIASLALAAAVFAASPAVANSGSDAEVAAARTSLAGNYLAGRAAGSQRDAAAAAAYFRAALKEDPRNAELLERTFLLTLVEGDMDGAMRLAERVVANDPSNRMAQLALAARAIRSHNYASARKHLARGAKGPLADLTANLLTGWTWIGSEKTAKALESVDKLQGADFFGTFRDYHAALMADLGGRREEASRRFAAALSGDGAALRIVQAAAIFRARNGDRDGALKLLLDFEKTAPRHPLMRETRTEIEQGREVRRTVADVSDGVAEVLYGIGGALGRQGGEDLSLVYLKLALYIEPTHPMALVTIADLYDQLNQFQDAIDSYAKVPDSSPLKRNADIQSAMDLDRLDKTDEAKATLAKLIAADPTDQEAIVALGNIERGREQFKEAAETYSRAIALVEAPPSQTGVTPAKAAEPTAYVVKSGESLADIAQDVYGDRNRWRELAAFNRTPEAERANGGPLPKSYGLKAGQKLLLPPKVVTGGEAVEKAPPSALAEGAKPTGEGAPAAGSAPQPDPNNWSLYYVRGIAYERSSEWAKSEADLKKAMELSPDQPLVMNYLGYSWIDQGVNLDEGMKLIKRAVELKPDDGYIVDSLGWAYFRLGKLDDAVRELERAVELRPQDPVMNDHLGDAYWRVGRKLEARFQWSHAKDLKPDEKDLPKIEAKLKDGLPDEKKTDAAEMPDKKNGG